MPTIVLAAYPVIGYHGTGGSGGSGSSWLLFVFLGVTATAGWLLFSRFRWRNTVAVAAAGWLLGFAVTFGL